MRILWLKTELLHPIDKGGKIRTYSMLRELKRKHEITYLTLDDTKATQGERDKALEYCSHLTTVPFAQPSKGSIRFYIDLLRNLASRRPYAIDKYKSSGMRRAIEAATATSQFDIVICDFLFPSINVPDSAGVPTVLFQHNVEASIWHRHASVPQHPVRRLYMREQWRRMHRWEERECRRFHHVVTVSDADRESIEALYGVRSVSSIPTGVDTDYFRQAAPAETCGHNIVFIGSMDWLPNEDGVTWFCDAVLPLIWKRVPDASLSVVGRSPSQRVRELARRVPQVTVTGTVPDVRPYIAQAAVVVVPLRIGGGTRLKIFEGMSMGRPTVSTSIGAEGLPVRDKEDLLIADDAETFAESTAELLLNPERGAAIGRRAAGRVRREFGWDSVATQFTRICEEIVRSSH